MKKKQGLYGQDTIWFADRAGINKEILYSTKNLSFSLLNFVFSKEFHMFKGAIQVKETSVNSNIFIQFSSSDYFQKTRLNTFPILSL